MTDEISLEDWLLVIAVALEEYRHLNAMDAHLYADLGLEVYKPAADRLVLVNQAIAELTRTSFMLHSFLCPY